MPVKTQVRRPLGNTKPGQDWEFFGGGKKKKIGQKIQIQQNFFSSATSRFSQRVAGLLVGEGKEGPSTPGKALPVGVGEWGWARLQIPWPNNAEQQSATGSGDLKHLTFVPQSSLPEEGCWWPGACRAAAAAGRSHKPPGTSPFFPVGTKTQQIHVSLSNLV